jgi:membrane protein implicated in regulation of membrane protease activity
MDIINLVSSYGPWAWVVGGLILLGIELVVPGGVLVWLGLSAIVVGLATLLLPLGWPVQWLLYGVLSIVSLVAWMRYARARGEAESDRPHLNQRAEQLVGRHALLKDAIENGFGRIELGDSVWRVAGPDLPQGAVVVVVGYDGAVLRVEAA